MDTPRRLLLPLATALLMCAVLAGPVLAVDEPEVDVATEADDEGHRIALADSPRDRLGLLLLGSLFIGGGLAFANARRQLKGERPQASGEFRWR